MIEDAEKTDELGKRLRRVRKKIEGHITEGRIRVCEDQLYE